MVEQASFLWYLEPWKIRSNKVDVERIKWMWKKSTALEYGPS